MRSELIKWNTSEHSLIEILLSTLYILHMIQDDKAKEEMSNHTYLPVLQSIVYENEEDNKHRLEGFTDVEMIYYFVDRQKHVDKNETLSETTVKDYIRDIFQFYKQLATVPGFFSTRGFFSGTNWELSSIS